MENVPRGSDGHRLFSPEFKREQVARLARGELTMTELSRELGIARSVLQRWKHLIAQGGETAVAASELRAAQQKIRELERLIGKQTVDLEILRAARREGCFDVPPDTFSDLTVRDMGDVENGLRTQVVAG